MNTCLLVLQPNKRLGVFSKAANDFTHLNLTVEEAADVFRARDLNFFEIGYELDVAYSETLRWDACLQAMRAARNDNAVEDLLEDVQSGAACCRV